MSLAAAAPAQGAKPAEARDANARAFDRQYLSFLLGGQVFAVPLRQVAEISPNRELNQIPHMPKGVEGLLDLRGQVVPIINLRTRLGLAHQDLQAFGNIVVLDLAGHPPLGVLVDKVASVITADEDELVTASPLLAGPEGAWVLGFILKGEEIIGLLDSRVATTIHGARAGVQIGTQDTLEQRLDEGLRNLIEHAPHKGDESARIIPQMEQAIAHTEQEMEKVLARVEAMLACTDQAFQGLGRLKQEAALGHMKGLEATLADIDRIGSSIQDNVFELIQKLQYQDIARQKLERVLNHIRGLQSVMGNRLRDIGKHD